MKPYTIAFDSGAYVPYGNVRSGINRIIDSFLRHIPSSSQTQFIAYTFGHSTEWSSSAHVQCIQLPAPFFGTVSMPALALVQKPDAFIGFSGSFPPLFSRYGGKKILFVHDTGFITKNKHYKTSAALRAQTESSLKRADHIVALSETVQHQFEEAFPKLVQNKLVLIRAGIDHLQKVKPEKPKDFEVTAPFFLYVGVIKPIKNIVELISLFDRYLATYPSDPHHLVLAGGHEHEYIFEVLNSAVYQKNRDKIHFLETVQDPELVYLYERASAFLNVSLEEGFCFPLGEALTAGCPAVVSKLPLYKEFSQFFPSLRISDSRQEFIMSMHSAKRIKKYTPERMFTWNSFSQSLIKLCTI